MLHGCDKGVAVLGVLLAWLACAASASAQKQWIGPNGGDWHTDANWDPAGVPGPTDEVAIQTATPVIATSDATVGAIDLQAGVEITAGRVLTIGDAAPSTWSAGTVFLSGSGTFVNGGQLTIANTVAVTSSGGGPHRFVNVGTVETFGPANVAIAAELDNDGVLRVPSGTVGQSGSVPLPPESTGDFVVEGTGLLALSNVVMGPAATAAGTGTLRFIGGASTVVGSGYALAGTTDVAAGGELILNGTGNTGALVFSSFFGTRGGTGTLNVGSGASDLSEGVFEDGGITDFTGSSHVTIDGRFDIVDHTLRLNGTTTWSFGNVVVFNSGTLENAGTLGIAGDVEYRMVGAGPFVFRTTGGTLNIPAGRTLGTNPPLTLDGGALSGAGTVNGSVTNAGAIVSPTGTLTILGDYTQGPGGRLHADIAAGGAHDRLQVDGTASLAGTLELVTATGFAPAPADVFRIVDTGSRSGAFAAVTGTPRYVPSYDATGVSVRVVEDAGPGVGPGPPAETTSQVPPPKTGETFNVEAAGGKVTVRLPDGRTVRIDDLAAIESGSVIDTRQGAARLTSEGAGGELDSGVFSDGLFRVTQTRGRKPVTELRLVEPLAACPKRGRASVAAKRKKKRRLWGDADGSFRTRGNYGNAINDGTRWLTEDRCNGTFFRVTRGKILVRRNGKRKAVRVRAGRSHLVRPR